MFLMFRMQVYMSAYKYVSLLLFQYVLLVIKSLK